MAWSIVAGPEGVRALADHARFGFVVTNGDGQQRHAFVEIAQSVIATRTEGLPSQVAEAVATDGRSALERFLADVTPPATVVVSSLGIRPRDPS